MYRGFKINLNKIEKNIYLFLDADNETYKKIGDEMFNSFRTEIKHKLDSFIIENGSIDCTAMQENWFPQIEADVFISHSHKDEDYAIAFAGWLKKELDIVAFIDSCIWGYSDELLEIFNNVKCINDDGTYNYAKRNRSTSLVHVMLSTALTMMIDNTECVFLLNTDNVITASSVVSEYTNSPWLYSEITISKLIQKKAPEKHLRRIRLFSKGKLKYLNESISPLFKVDTSYLDTISGPDLSEWEINQKKNSYFKYSLDELYKIIPPQDLKNR